MKGLDIISALEGVIRESLQITTNSFSYLSYFLSALFVVFITILSWFIINVIKYKN